MSEWETVFEYREDSDRVRKGTKCVDDDGRISVFYSREYKGKPFMSTSTTVNDDLAVELFFYDKVFGGLLGGTWLIMDTVQRQVTGPGEAKVKEIRSQYPQLRVDKFREIMGPLTNMDIEKAKTTLKEICESWQK